MPPKFSWCLTSWRVVCIHLPYIPLKSQWIICPLGTFSSPLTLKLASNASRTAKSKPLFLIPTLVESFQLFGAIDHALLPKTLSSLSLRGIKDANLPGFPSCCLDIPSWCPKRGFHPSVDLQILRLPRAVFFFGSFPSMITSFWFMMVSESYFNLDVYIATQI